VPLLLPMRCRKGMGGGMGAGEPALVPCQQTGGLPQLESAHLPEVHSSQPLALLHATASWLSCCLRADELALPPASAPAIRRGESSPGSVFAQGKGRCARRKARFGCRIHVLSSRGPFVAHKTSSWPWDPQGFNCVLV